MASTFIVLPPKISQPLGPTDSPTFNNLTLTALAMFGVVHTDNSGTLSTSLIVDADVDPAAEISLSKLDDLVSNRALISNGSGTIDVSITTDTELSYLSGADSNIQDQIDAIAGGITALTGDVAATGPGSAVATIQPGVVTGSKIASDTITNLNINSAAAIARSKIATGSASHVVINDGTGALSSESVLSISRGGTGTSSTFTQGSIIFAGASGVYSQDNTNLNYTDSTDTLQLGGFFEFGATNQTISSLNPFQFIDSTVTLTAIVEAPMIDLKPTFVQGIDGSGGGNQFGYVGIINRPTIKNPNSSIFDIDIVSALYDVPTVQADGQSITCTGMLTFNSAPILNVINGGTLTVTNLAQFIAQANVNTGATITTRRALWAFDAIGSGAVTTQTGVYIASLTKGGTNWAIETAGTTNSRFGGKLQLGSASSTPSGVLDINNIASTDVSIQIDGAAAQSANYIDVNDSSGNQIYDLSSAGTTVQAGNIQFTKEVNHTIGIQNSTTSGAAGATLTIQGASATLGNANGGPITVTTGGANALGAGGNLTLETAGAGGVAPGNIIIRSNTVFSSGTIAISNGNVGGSNNTGTISVSTGTIATGTSGNITLTTGSASGAGTVGNIVLTAGTSTGGTGGTISLVAAGVTALQILTDGVTSIRAGGASDTAKVGGTINVSTSSTGNVGTGEDDLISYTLPAAILSTNGDSVELIAAGTIVNNANAKRIRVKFGATNILDTGAAGIPINAAADWIVRATVIRTGATTQKALCTFTINNVTTTTTSDYTTAGETLSGTVVFKITGEATSNNDIVQEMAVYKWYPNNT